MSGVTIDASVWIASADPSDTRCAICNTLLDKLVVEGVFIHVPAFAAVEVACAIARKLRDGPLGVKVADFLLLQSAARSIPISDRLLNVAKSLGSDSFLRGADALYQAVAKITGSELISLDQDHLTRAGGVSPQDWLASHQA